MAIDVHTHFVPEHIPKLTGSGNSRWPHIECGCQHPNHRKVMIDGKNFRTITDQCWSPSRRMEDMDAEGVTAQVLSPMPELLSYWFSPAETLELSRYMNEEISKVVQVDPKRFFGLGMLPLQDPELAASEVARLKNDFGLCGVEVGTNINGKSIGDPCFMPFFEAAASEGICIFIHALHPFGKERLVGPPALNAIAGFPTENAYAAVSLISGGILEKLPDLRIAISHGGGTFPSMLPRFIRGWEEMEPIAKALPQSPMHYARKLFYDTLVYDHRTLQHLIELVGHSQVLVGSDYPFLIRETEPGRKMERLTLTDAERQAILFDNCRRFLGIVP